MRLPVISFVLLISVIAVNSFSPGHYFTGSQITDTIIHIGNQKMHFRVSRGGEPTVLLESGGGADASQWNVIQQRLTAETKATIVSYDRAGFGASDLPKAEYDIKKEAQQLHASLDMLGVKKLLLVSHSYGAFVSQAYQHLYPQNIHAIILLDPNTVEFVDSVGVQNLSRLPFDTTGVLSPQQKAELRQIRGFRSTIDQLRSMPFSKDHPMIIVTAGVDWWPFPQVNAWWHASQKNIAKAVPGTKLIVADSCAHNIPALKPGFVVELIKKHLAQ